MGGRFEILNRQKEINPRMRKRAYGIGILVHAWKQALYAYYRSLLGTM